MYFSIYVNNKKIWKDGAFINSNNKISYDSISGDFIVFKFQAGTYQINTLDDFKLIKTK